MWCEKLIFGHIASHWVLWRTSGCFIVADLEKMCSADRTNLISEPSNSFDDRLNIFSKKNSETGLHTELFWSLCPLSWVIDFSHWIKGFIFCGIQYPGAALPTICFTRYLRAKAKFSRTNVVKVSWSNMRSPSTEREQQIPFNTSCSHRYRLLQWNFLNIIQEALENSPKQLCQQGKCWIFHQLPNAES